MDDGRTMRLDCGMVMGMDCGMVMGMDCGIMVVLAGAEHGGHKEPRGQQHGSSKCGFVIHAVILPDSSSSLSDLSATAP
jgi:hypothetical protein